MAANGTKTTSEKATVVNAEVAIGDSEHQVVVRNFMRMAEEQNLDQLGALEQNEQREIAVVESGEDDGFEILLITTAKQILQDPRYQKQLEQLTIMAKKRILNTAGRIVEICLSHLYEFLKSVGLTLLNLCQNKWVKLALFLLLGFLLLVAVKRFGVDTNMIIQALADFLKLEFTECLSGRASRPIMKQ